MGKNVKEIDVHKLLSRISKKKIIRIWYISHLTKFDLTK